MNVVLLSGGTGGAKLAVGLASRLGPGELTVLTNPADDVEVWGLRVCPDADAVLFRLAGIFNEEAGYGVRNDSAAVLGQLGALGEPTWFHLGDRDLAFHLLRTDWLRQGRRVTEVMLELGARLGVATRVLPVTDSRVATVFETGEGPLGFQEYFVRRRLEPVLEGIHFEGIEVAHPTPEAERALAAADLVVIGPSNPLISIDPILRVIGPRLSPMRTVAVSPVVGGRALKGPTVEMLQKFRGDAAPVTVARDYRPFADCFVLDEQDRDQEAAIAALGLTPLVLDTVMRDAAGAARVAEQLLSAVGE